MGLPLFITPVEPEEAAKNSEKAAAHSRSAIRRQRTVRRPNHQLRPEERGVRTPFDGLSIPILPDHVPDFTDIVSPTEEAEHEVRVAAGRRLRDTVRSLPPASLLSRGNAHRIQRGSGDRPSLPPQQGADAAPISQATAFSTTSPMPPVPESRDFQGSRRSLLYARRERSRPWAEYGGSSHNHPMESHPTMSRRETSSDFATNGSGTQLPALTPNFSPARRYALEESRNRRRSDSPSSFAYYPSYSADTQHPSSLSRVRSPSHELRSLRDLPPLRRMGRRSIADVEARRLRVRAARLDGLGDRERSLSPDGESAWETMLTTLTPDPQLPSAGSSFASASAATSASSTSDSQNTSLTTMSSLHNPSDSINAAHENVCDILEDSQDSSSVMSDTEAEDEDDVYELRDDRDARDRFWRSYADVVASRVDRVARHREAADPDNLGGMQHIVRRLARREDIPDEWWAEAGLSRNFPLGTVRL